MSAAADAIAKARAIAAKLSMGSANPSSAGGVQSDLGKRKSRDDDGGGGGGSYYQPQTSGAGCKYIIYLLHSQ